MTKIKNALLILISLIVIMALILNFDLIADKFKKLFNDGIASSPRVVGKSTLNVPLIILYGYFYE